MKKITIYLSSGIIAVFLLSGFVLAERSGLEQDEEKNEVLNYMPDNINTLINQSCFGCHNTEGRNEDAKEELNFTNWEEYSIAKKLQTLGKICETIEEGEMPPARFLEFSPEAKLSDEEIQLICEWAEIESDKLLEE